MSPLATVCEILAEVFGINDIPPESIDDATLKDRVEAWWGDKLMSHRESCKDRAKFQKQVETFQARAFPAGGQVDAQAAAFADTCIAWLKDEISCDVCGIQDTRKPHCAKKCEMFTEPCTAGQQFCQFCEKPATTILRVKSRVKPGPSEGYCRGAEGVPHMKWVKFLMCDYCTLRRSTPFQVLTSGKLEKLYAKLQSQSS